MKSGKDLVFCNSSLMSVFNCMKKKNQNQLLYSSFFMVNKFLTVVILSAHFIESIRYIKSNIAHIGSNTSRSAQLYYLLYNLRYNRLINNCQNNSSFSALFFTNVTVEVQIFFERFVRYFFYQTLG